MEESDTEETDQLFSGRSANRTPIKMFILTGLAAMGGLLFGYDTGVVSGAMMLVKREIPLSTTWHEFIVSATIGSAFLSSLVTGTLADRFGRRQTILLASVQFILGSLLLSAASGKGTLLLGRLIVGVGVGLASVTVPLYIGECSAPELRGLLVALNNAAITFGQLTAGIICGCLVHAPNGWRYMLGLAAVPAGIQLMGFYAMPESPRYLVKKERYGEARSVLSTIRGPFHQIEDEFEDIKIASRQSESLSFGAFLAALPSDRHARMSVFLGCLLQLCQQLAGINTVMYYAASIIKMAGASDTTAIWFSALTAGLNFLLSLVGMRLVQIMPRRRLLFASLTGVVTSLLLIAASFAILGETSHNNYNHNNISTTEHNKFEMKRNAVDDVDPSPGQNSGVILVLISLSLYIIAFAPGMGPLPWTINSEIHPSWCRAHAQSLSTATNWICNLLVSITFLSFVDFLGRPVTFCVYAVFTIICGGGLYLYLPETQGVQLEEMGTLFSTPVNTPSSGRVLYSRIPME